MPHYCVAGYNKQHIIIVLYSISMDHFKYHVHFSCHVCDVNPSHSFLFPSFTALRDM